MCGICIMAGFDHTESTPPLAGDCYIRILLYGWWCVYNARELTRYFIVFFLSFFLQKRQCPFFVICIAFRIPAGIIYHYIYTQFQVDLSISAAASARPVPGRARAADRSILCFTRVSNVEI